MQGVNASAAPLADGEGPGEREIARLIDHALLRPELDDSAVAAGVRLAAQLQVASVCVRPSDVARAARLLAGSGVTTGTVVGFPHGSQRTQTKVFEARLALAEGASELDMVIDIGALRSGRDSEVLEQIAAVAEVAHTAGAVLKVILETSLLDHAAKVRGCSLAEEAGADFVKTSTGFGPGGAIPEDVALLRRSVSPRLGVKAAGGIRTLDEVLALIAAGATRIGTSHTAAILDEARRRRQA